MHADSPAQPARATSRKRLRVRLSMHASGCKTASKKISSFSRAFLHTRCALAQTEPRTNALFPVASVSGPTINRYAYANNNPMRYIDPTGEYAEAPAELASIGLGAKSAIDNFRSGNIAAGVVDVIGIAVDIVGLAVPGVPGVAGLSIQAGRQAAKAGEKAGNKAAVELTEEQAKNVARFTGKVPANAKQSVTVGPLPNGGVVAQATSPGKVPGSSAVYEKQIDATGKTIEMSKTTYDPAGNLVHVKVK